MNASLFFDIISAIFLLVGAFFVAVGAIGMYRLPDFYTRLHGAGITDTLGAGLILVGLTFQAGLTLASIKLIMIVIFLFVTSPTSCHALAQAARALGVEPQGLLNHPGAETAQATTPPPDDATSTRQ